MKRDGEERQPRKKIIGGLVIGFLIVAIGGIAVQGTLFSGAGEPVATLGGNGGGNIEDAGDVNDSIEVLLLTNDVGGQVEKALRLEETFTVQVRDSVPGPDLVAAGFEVAVLANHAPSEADITALHDFFIAGGKIFIIFGPRCSNITMLLERLGISINARPSSLGGTGTTGIDYTLGEDAESHPLVSLVQWSSTPSIRNHTILENSNVTLDVLLRDRGPAHSPFLVTHDRDPAGGETDLVMFTPWVVEGGNNYQVELWPYFNYFIFLVVEYLARGTRTTGGQQALPTYADWPHSPVPHLQDTITIMIVVSILGTTAFVLFFVQRSRSRKSGINLSTRAMKEITREMKGQEVQDEQGEEEPDEMEDISDEWEQVGTHRQISGFLFGLFAGILLGIPQIVLTGIIFPKFIMPFPQVAGWFDWTKQFFQAIWMLFDVGTSIALAKYFAQYRIKQPRKAIHYIQIFTWWQLLSGVVQIVLISLVGSVVFPRTNFAHLSWMVILHSLIQYPGFFVVFLYIFQGMQRTDLQNLGNLLYQAVLMLLSQYMWILIFRAIFKDDPQGEAFWAGIGYCVGQYFAEWSIFFIMMAFYKKLGFSVSTIFRVDFTAAELKEALVFGGKEAAGHVWVPLALMYQVWLLGAFLPNYNEEMGLYGYANMLMQVTALVGFLTEGFLAPVSESHSYRKQRLLDFTLAQGIKWANFIIFYMIALLAATGQQFIALLAGENWLGATRFIPPMLIYALMQPWAWLGDKVLAGTGYTGRAAAIWIAEQGGKMVLLSLYMFVFNFKDIIIILAAHIPVLVVKCSVSWMIIRRKVGKPKVHAWNSWIAPGLASIIVYALLSFLTWLFAFPGGILVVFILGIFGIFYLYSFLCGFLGCYDDNTIAEYSKAASMVAKPVQVFARLLYLAARAGCRASPGLHGRFPMDTFPEAMAEARELEREKRKLRI